MKSDCTLKSIKHQISVSLQQIYYNELNLQACIDKLMKKYLTEVKYGI